MPDKIEEIRAALEGATPGPWKIGIDTDVYAEGECDTWITLGPQNYDAVALVVNEHIKNDAEVGINARLIALAPDMARIVLAAAEMAETHKAMLRMLDHALKGTRQGDMAISPDHGLTLVEAWKRDAAYRKAVEGGE